LGGLALDFYWLIGKISNFSPASAETLFLKMLEEAGVTVVLNCHLESVKMEAQRIQSVTMESGLTVNAAMFIDATYEGDLMAAANVS
jgi:hypothetical protein